MISKRRRPIIIVTSIILGVICAAHIWDARYHFRMVPLPLWAYEAISEVLEEKIFTPPPTKSFTNKLPLFDFDTKLGREEALEYVRKLVPNFGPRMTYENLSIESWFSRIQVKNGYCTDFSILLISLAAKAGLPAREWILWHDNQWSLGSAHSIVEIRLSNCHGRSTRHYSNLRQQTNLHGICTQASIHKSANRDTTLSDSGRGWAPQSGLH